MANYVCMYVNRSTYEAIRAIGTKFCTKFTLLDIKRPTGLCRVRTEGNIGAVWASVNDDHILSIVVVCNNWSLLLNKAENFKEGFRCEVFQNTAGVGIEAERPAAKQNFW